MFRTFLIRIALMAAVTTMTAAAVATAGGKSPVRTPTPAKFQAGTGAVKSAVGSQTRNDKHVRMNSNAKSHTQQTDKNGVGPKGAVKLSGESVVGDQNAPKSLVLVPWKSAKIGKMPGLSMLLDDSVRPVDKDVFMRELAYYRIRVHAK